MPGESRAGGLHLRDRPSRKGTPTQASHAHCSPSCRFPVSTPTPNSPRAQASLRCLQRHAAGSWNPLGAQRRQKAFSAGDMSGHQGSPSSRSHVSVMTLLSSQSQGEEVFQYFTLKSYGQCPLSEGPPGRISVGRRQEPGGFVLSHTKPVVLESCSTRQLRQAGSHRAHAQMQASSSGGRGSDPAHTQPAPHGASTPRRVERAPRTTGTAAGGVESWMLWGFTGGGRSKAFQSRWGTPS